MLDWCGTRSPAATRCGCRSDTPCPRPLPEHLGRITRAIAHFCTLFADRKIADSPRDGLLGGSNGERLTPGDAPAPGFSRMRACLALIRRLRNPHFLAEVRKPGLNSQFNDRQISRALEHAHFLPDGTPVFEQMWGSSRQLGVKHEDYSGLAVWIALDALGHLFPDDMDTALSPGCAPSAPPSRRNSRTPTGYPRRVAVCGQIGPDPGHAARGAGQNEHPGARRLRRHPRTAAPAGCVPESRDERPGRYPWRGGLLPGVGSRLPATCARAIWRRPDPHLRPAVRRSGNPATLRRWQDNRERVFARNGRTAGRIWSC